MSARNTFLAALITAFASIAALSSAHAQTASGAPSFEECEAAVDEDALRLQTIAGAQAAIETSIASVNYASIVDDAWDGAFFDRRFERIVDDKIEEIRSDRSLFERLADANLPSFAEEIAERTARAVFGSAEFEALQEILMAEIARRLEPKFQIADGEANDTATQCVQVYLGARYASVVQTALADELASRADADVEVALSTSDATISLAGILGGLLVVAFRRVVRRVVQSMAQRLVGVIAARIASWGTIVIGAAVLTYELISGADGIFPAIREEMLSRETKLEIQQTIVDELETVGVEALTGRAEAIGGEIVDRWRAFRDNHRRVLELAEREPAVASYLGQLRPQDFEKFSALVAVLHEEGGDPAVLTALESGLLPRAMRVPMIDDQARTLAPQGVTLEALTRWADLAGGDYQRVLALRLPTVIAPDAIDRAGVRKLLELDTPERALKIAGLASDARDELLQLRPDDLRVMAREFGGDELEAVLGAVRAASGVAARQRFLQQVVAAPEQARALTDPDVASIVSDSRSPDAALDVLLDPASRWDVFALVGHVDAVASGDVAPMALVHRYGWLSALFFGVPLFILLGLLRSVGRVFAPRRR